LDLSYWIDYLGFITEGKLVAVLITPSLGVPNWSVIYIINTAPSEAARAEEEAMREAIARSLRGIVPAENSMPLDAALDWSRRDWEREEA
jgi:hypothetical protein